MIADLNSTAQVLSDAGVGAVVDIESLLGLEESLLQVRLGASYEIAPSHRIWLDYVNLSRHAHKVLTENVEIGGETYPTGTEVETDFDLQLVNLVYGYSVIHDDRVDLALTFGMHGMQTQLELQGQTVGTASEDFFLPIPLPGVRMSVVLAKDLYFKTNLELLWLRIGDFEGLMVDAMVGVEWAAFEHVGFGLAYSNLRIKLDMEDGDFGPINFSGTFEFGVSGILLYTVLYF
jgi:hypothetical protein